jgi:electron transfer flavoprotein alpha/beta subunit
VTVKHAAVLGDEHEFTADGRDIQPDFLEHELNEWDDAALEEALQLIEGIGEGEVVAVCVGPEAAEASLRKVLAKGAQRAIRVWHDELLAADPLLVARAIAGVAIKEQPDLVLTGVQSSDHSHGATGSALARILDMPHAAVVVELEWSGEGPVEVTRELEGGTRHKISVPAPALLSIQTGGNIPRYATMRMIKKAKKIPIDVLDARSVLEGGGGYQVQRMYTPVQNSAQMLEGSSDDIASFIANIIRDKRGT